MKKLLYYGSAIIAGFGLALLTGCNTPDSPQGTVGASYNDQGTAAVNAGLDVTSNINVGVTGEYNVPSGNWSAGFVVTFKDAVTPDFAKQMQDVGGQPVRGGVAFAFPGVKSANDPKYFKALQLAASQGDFEVKALK